MIPFGMFFFLTLYMQRPLVERERLDVVVVGAHIFVDYNQNARDPTIASAQA